MIRIPLIFSCLSLLTSIAAARIEISDLVSRQTTTTGDPSSYVPPISDQRMIIAHGILCVLGFFLFLPTGALLGRYLRTSSPVWFKGHWIVQFAVTGPIIIIGVSLGFAVVNHGSDRQNEDDGHKNAGTAIVVLYIIQCALGGVIHWVKPKKTQGRPPQNYLHVLLGVLLFGLSAYAVRSGYKTAWPTLTGRGQLSISADILWYIWTVLIPILYFTGLALLPKQLSQEKAAQADATRAQFEALELHRQS